MENKQEASGGSEAADANPTDQIKDSPFALAPGPIFFSPSPTLQKLMRSSQSTSHSLECFNVLRAFGVVFEKENKSFVLFLLYAEKNMYNFNGWQNNNNNNKKKKDKKVFPPHFSPGVQIISLFPKLLLECVTKTVCVSKAGIIPLGWSQSVISRRLLP